MPMDSSKEFRISSIVVPLIAIIAGVFMVVLDNTVMNVALPKLVTDFHTQLPTLEWTVTGYTLAQAAVIPLSGWLAEIRGEDHLSVVNRTFHDWVRDVFDATLRRAVDFVPNSSGAWRWQRASRGDGVHLPVNPAGEGRSRHGHDGDTHPVCARDWPRIGWVAGTVPLVAVDFPLEFTHRAPLPADSSRDCHSGRNRTSPGWTYGGRFSGRLHLRHCPTASVKGQMVGTVRRRLRGLSSAAWHSRSLLFAELRSDTPLLELRVFKSIDFTLAIIVQWVGQFALFGALL